MNTPVLQWLADHDAELHVSVLSLGEMLKGIHLMDAGNRRHEIERSTFLHITEPNADQARPLPPLQTPPAATQNPPGPGP